jgi:hypothetical protein
VFAPSQKLYPLPACQCQKLEFSMAAFHYVKENKVTYNFWKNLAKIYFIESNGVNALRHGADAVSSHYLTENKRVIGFIGRRKKTGCN